MKIARLVSLLIGLVLIPLAAFGDTLKLNGSTVGDLSITSGTLEVAGFSEATSLTLGPAAQYIVDLNATFWDKTIDYLAVRGNVSLGGATLVLNRVSMFPGQTHTIIRNDGRLHHARHGGRRLRSNRIAPGRPSTRRAHSDRSLSGRRRLQRQRLGASPAAD
jgi:hypothetical protein